MTARAAAVSITLGERSLGLKAIEAALAGPVRVALHPLAVKRCEAAHEVLRRAAAGDAAVYGANTGFGRLALERIPADDLRTLQLNLVRSHAAGVGEPLPGAIVRLTMLLKLNSLAAGYAGVSKELLELMTRCINEDLLPVVPAQGSVGASGDLAPLAHLALVLVGRGEARYRGRTLSGEQALSQAGLAPVELGPKEGLDLINGTQVSAAQALAGMIEARRNLKAAVVIGALSCDAFRATDVFADPRLNALKPHPGQVAVARVLRRLWEGSEIRASHLDCDRVQDPYSFRCQPQVMGACLDLVDNARRTLLIEANAVTENPLVFARQEEVVSGGNFHGQARCLRRRRAGAGDCGNRFHVGTPHRGAGDRRAQQPAAVPDAGPGAQLRLHAGPRHGRGPGQREQAAGHAGQRRQHPHFRQPGGPREHVGARLAAPGPHERQRGGHPGRSSGWRRPRESTC